MDKDMPVNRQGLTEQTFLETYDEKQFERLSITVDMLIFTVMDEEKENYRKLPEKVLKLLMVKRGDHPHMGKWALPGGFVGKRESLEAAAIRKLKGEANIDPKDGALYMEQLYTWGDVDRDPRTRVVSCSYMSLVDSTSFRVMPGEGAAEARWFTVSIKLLETQKIMTDKGYIIHSLIRLDLEGIPNPPHAKIRMSRTVEGRRVQETQEIVEADGIAFDHAGIIAYGILRLRNKIEYTDIAFNLMPERFTLTELQQVYEVILDKTLLKANFRRKIADMVIETDEYTKDAGHRPSKLYRFNPNWVDNRFD